MNLLNFKKALCVALISFQFFSFIFLFSNVESDHHMVSPTNIKAEVKIGK
ncbi:MAG: hypothetical protein FWG91_00665 [Lachnospiraceae bacterium]|nr:hypothetical protein [Lachnospiraceae bacterium]